jgi:hypothetical protein
MGSEFGGDEESEGSGARPAALPGRSQHSGCGIQMIKG